MFKKALISIITILIVTAGQVSLANAEPVKVQFQYNGTSEIIEAEIGDIIEPIEAPTKEGYIFIKWQNLKNYEDFDFTKPLEGDVRLAAQWKKEKKSDLGEIVANKQKTEVTGNSPTGIFGLSNETVDNIMSRLDIFVFGLTGALVIVGIGFAIVLNKEKKKENASKQETVIKK